MLDFAYIDLGESRKSTSDCASTFDNLLSTVHSQIDRKLSELASALSAIDEAAAAERAAAEAKKADEGDADVEMDGEKREGERKNEEARQKKKEEVKTQAKPEIDELKEAAALVWIKYMQFLRRTEVSGSSRAHFVPSILTK